MALNRACPAKPGDILRFPQSVEDAVIVHPDAEKLLRLMLQREDIDFPYRLKHVTIAIERLPDEVLTSRDLPGAYDVHPDKQ